MLKVPGTKNAYAYIPRSLNRVICPPFHVLNSVCIVHIVYKPLQFPLFHVWLVKEVLKHRRLRLPTDLTRGLQFDSQKLELQFVCSRRISLNPLYRHRHRLLRYMLKFSAQGYTKVLSHHSMSSFGDAARLDSKVDVDVDVDVDEIKMYL